MDVLAEDLKVGCSEGRPHCRQEVVVLVMVVMEVEGHLALRSLPWPKVKV